MPDEQEVAVQMLLLERIDGSRSMSRYYVLAVTPTLFGDTALVREWGRIGASTSRRIDIHVDETGAREALSTWLGRKTKRGYVIARQA